MRFLFTFFVFSSGSMAFSDDLVIKKNDTKIYKEANKTSQEVGTAKQGEKIPMVSKERKGMFWQTEKGYVFMMDGNVKSQTPSEDSVAASIQKNQSQNKDSVRTRSAVMGVRGLDDHADTSKIGNVAPKMQAVEVMEKNQESAKKDVQTIQNEIQKETQNK